MATGRVGIDTGSMVALASYTIVEDAETKYLGRSVLANTAGTELSTVENPLRVNLVAIGTGTLAAITTVGSVGVVGNISSIGALVTVGGTINSVTTIVTVATVTSINTLATISSMFSLANVGTINAVSVVSTVNFVKACVLSSGVDTIGNIKYNGVGYTPISKFVTLSSAGDGLLWEPAGGKSFVITDLTMSAAGSTTVYLAEGASSYIMQVYLNKFGGISRNLVTPFIGAKADTDLLINSSASTVSAWVLGYEV
jgi:hypothetical protein